MVIDDTTTQFISLTDLKAHLNITTTVDDVELEMVRAAAEAHVEALVGAILHRTVTETLTARNGAVALRQLPALAVTSATSSGAALTTTLDSSAGLVALNRTVSGAVEVTYTVGRTSVPESVRLATLIVAAHMWDTQRGNTPSAYPGAAGAVDETVTFGLGFTVPNRAMELLSPYLLVPGVA